MTILRMRFACWITKATDTHTECVIPNIVDSSTRYIVAVQQCQGNALLRVHGSDSHANKLLVTLLSTLLVLVNSVTSVASNGVMILNDESGRIG
jgi:hypothetical protein